MNYLGETTPGFDEFDPKNLSDDWKFAESLLENLTNDPKSSEIPTDYIDKIVEDWDYMELDGYLNRISDDIELIEKIMEYIQFNYPEFFEDIQVAGWEKIRTQGKGKDLSKDTFPNPKLREKSHEWKIKEAMEKMWREIWDSFS